MPGRNGTGPMGMGPMTGRGAGNCAGVTATNRGRGRFGCGMGPGYGYGCGAVRGGGDDPALLRRQAERLQSRLDDVHRRLDGIPAAE